MFEDEKVRERAARDRFHQSRIVMLHPEPHTAPIKAIILQEWRGWAQQ